MISVLKNTVVVEILKAENNRPILSELENGAFRIFELATLVSNRNPFFEIVNDVLGHIIEGGIFVHIKNRSVAKEKLESKVDSPAVDDTY